MLRTNKQREKDNTQHTSQTCFVDKLGRELLKIYKLSINFTFEGGFAVDADFTDAFSGSIEGPKINKNP
jgi:hypothetical protein